MQVRVPVESNARPITPVENRMGLFDEAALFQRAQMFAHRRRGEDQPVGELARPPRPFAETLTGSPPIRIGERRQYLTERRAAHSYIFVVSPLARSHSSGVICFTVWPNVQMWPSRSRAR
jgi:hypothetical protein